ncbi:MAG: hypothetical protein ISR69_10865 [Gammaproteobacteria bacterium]|nr:hypothetical protein [Gammaproteobacteria bacterium]
MSKLDAKKETISFLTKLFFVLVGVIVVALSELISMLKSDDISFIFWLGIVSIFILSFGCLSTFKHIQKNIKEIEEL